MTARQTLHELIDQWPESELEALEEWLRAALRGRGSLSLGETSFTDEEVEDEEDMAKAKPISNEEFRRILDEAPLDDEPLSQAELEALRRWEQGPRRTISHDELMKKLGL